MMFLFGAARFVPARIQQRKDSETGASCRGTRRDITVMVVFHFFEVRRKLMRSIATLTTRGRVTIPKAIRDELGLEPYDRIRFMLEDGCAVLQKTYPSLEELA